MDRFGIAQDVKKLLPKMPVVVVFAYNPNSKGESSLSTASATLAALSIYHNAQSYPRIALYRDTLKAACNLSAMRFSQPNESLSKWLSKARESCGPPIPSSASVAAGELVYVQDRTIWTLNLAWRQTVERLVPEKTENNILKSEVSSDEVEKTSLGASQTRR